MQALHDHFGGDEEQEGPIDNGDAGEKQISHSPFWEGGFTKVHFLHAQDIVVDGIPRVWIFLGFMRTEVENEIEDYISTYT